MILKRRYTGKSLAGILIAMAVLTVGVFYYHTPPAEALSDTLLDDTVPIYLGIGHHTSFDGVSMKLGAYYDADDPWNDSRTINIFGGDPAIWVGAGCRAATWLVGMDDEDDYATVRISVYGGGTITYRIKAKNFCTGSATHNNSRTALGDARFIGRYQLPLGGAAVDPGTDMYKVSIDIAFTSEVYSEQDDNYNPNVFFRVRSPGGTAAVMGGGWINTRVYNNDLEHNRHVVEFGAPCSLSSATNMRFGVHDPDNYSPTGGPTSTQGSGSSAGYRAFVFYLEEKIGAGPYVPLHANRYSIVGSSGVKYSDGTRTVIESTTRQDVLNGVSDDSLVDFDMQPDAKYRFVAYNVYVNNFLQIRLPTDGIYNTVDCDTSTEVEGGVSIGPNPVTVGSQVETDAWIKNLGSNNDGEVNYDYRIWLDDGDGSFVDGDDDEIYLTEDNVEINPNDQIDLPHVNRDIADGSMVQVCVGLWIEGVGSTTVADSPVIECSPIGRYPQTQISGGDVIAGGQVSTVVHQIDSGNYGSWIEYSIFAAGNVVSISGASLPAGGYGAVGDRTALTFANSNPPALPGNFAPSIGSFAGNLGIGNGPWQNWATSSIPLPATITSTGQIVPNEINTRSGDITIDEALTVGQSYVIHTTGNVVINRSIEYENSSYSSLDELPQLVIIADGYIRIHPNVRQVDAWLISNAQTLTCAGSGMHNPSPDYFTGLTSTNCNRQLVVNGPIQAGSLYLRRTGGAGADGTSAAQRSTPAEVINLRSDAYLWAYGQASQDQVIRTDSVKELPPRF